MRIILTVLWGFFFFQLNAQIDSLLDINRDGLSNLSDTLLMPSDSLVFTDTLAQKGQKRSVVIDPNLQLWQSLDKYEIEQNSLILSPEGWYKFYEQDVVLLEDSLAVPIELGTYQLIENSIQLMPLTGKSAYHPYHYQISNQNDSLLQIVDYEKGNSGHYSLHSSPAFNDAELDFFKGIALHNALLKTTWLATDTQESWQFIAPDYALIKTEGVQEFTAQVLFSEGLITFINPQNGNLIFRAEVTHHSEEQLQIIDLRKGRQLSFQKQKYAGLTARETNFYRQYVRVLYNLEIEDLPSKLLNQ